MVSVLLIIRHRFLSTYSSFQMYKYVTVSPGTKRRKAEEDADVENAQNSEAAAVVGPDAGDQLPDQSNACAQDVEGFTFQEKEGDLFSCPPSWSLAHCISVDAHMGKGIAVMFKTKFKGVDEIRKQGAKIGGCAVLKRDNRYIYYLTTKERYFEKPTYDSLRSSLETMKKHCIEHEVKNIGMPMIGCGLDRLQWHKVKEMIREVFIDSSIAITVYYLGKAAAADAKQTRGPSSYRPRGGYRKY